MQSHSEQNKIITDKNAAIGVFDSGLGGLTAVRELHKLLPKENIIYFGDTGRVPYGTRGTDTIIEYAKQDIAFLLSKNVKYIMAACGTVSSTLAQSYTNTLPVPYTGVVSSAAKAAVNATKSGKIGIIGTPASINSGSYTSVIKSLNASAVTVSTSCPLFVPLVENGYFEKDNKVAKLVAQDYLKDIKAADVDTLILGCTHYPLLAPVIADVMGDDVTLIDPGAQTSLCAKRTLLEMDMLCDEDRERGEIEYFASDSTENFVKLAKTFLGDCDCTGATRIRVDEFVPY